MSIFLKRSARVMAAYLISVSLAYVLASIAATQFVLSQLASLGYSVTVSQRLLTLTHDVLGMAPFYGVILLVTLGIAFSVASFISSYIPRFRAAGLIGGSAIAVVFVHLIMQRLFSLSPLYSAGDLVGLITQGFAGGVGGFFYYLMRRT